MSTPKEYDRFEAEMLAAGKAREEIERLWNIPPDPMDDDETVIAPGERDAEGARVDALSD